MFYDYTKEAPATFLYTENLPAELPGYGLETLGWVYNIVAAQGMHPNSQYVMFYCRPPVTQ